MIKARVLTLLTALTLLLTLPTTAYAQGVPPHIFVGHAMVDGDEAMDGTIVTAMIGEDTKGSDTVMDGRYTLQVKQGEGTEISFMVGSMKVMEQGSWVQGGTTLMDLMVGSDPMMPKPVTATATGEPGKQGPAGPAGPRGDDGADGAVGATGPEGPAGPAGPEGPAGTWDPTGPAGMLSEPGAPGPAGPAGQMGPAGLDGTAGGNTLSIIALAISIAALAGAGGAWYLIRSG